MGYGAAQAGESALRRVRQSQFEVSPHVVAIELHLVDGLSGARVLQLEWAIGGDHQQRQKRKRGFDQSREVMSGRAPGGAQDRDRAPCCPHEPERCEGRAAFVNDGVTVQAPGLERLPRERGRA
jgi:hypothetical protein